MDVQPLPTRAATPSSETLREAARWLADLADENATPADHRAWQAWVARSPAHAQAWQRAQRLADLLGDVPPAIGAAPLHGLPDGATRRAVLAGGAKTALAAVLCAPVGWLGWHRQVWQYAQADLCTGIGEQRTCRLADGSALTLNTDTRVALHDHATAPRVVLLRGEIALRRATGAVPPLFVQTRDGVVRHTASAAARQSTDFAARVQDGGTALALAAGALAAWPGGAAVAPPETLQQGQRAILTAAGLGRPTPLPPHSLDWALGLLVARAMPLGDVVAELARFRPGVLACDPAVAGRAVSGVFHLANTDQALALLARTLGLRIVARTPWWVRLEAG